MQVGESYPQWAVVSYYRDGTLQYYRLHPTEQDALNDCRRRDRVFRVTLIVHEEVHDV